MFIGILQAEKLIGQIESGDLPTAVAENFLGADGAGHDFVKMLGGFILAKDLGAPQIGDADAGGAND
ncbi:MAG: hypothetical protein WBG15_03055 [Xanthobacteraceae bacterium]